MAAPSGRAAVAALLLACLPRALGVHGKWAPVRTIQHIDPDMTPKEGCDLPEGPFGWCKSVMGSPNNPYWLVCENTTRQSQRRESDLMLAPAMKADYVSTEEYGLPKGFKRKDGKPPVALILSGADGMGEKAMMFAKEGYHVILVEPRPQVFEQVNAAICMSPDIKDSIQVVHAVARSSTGSEDACNVCDILGHFREFRQKLTCPGEENYPSCKQEHDDKVYDMPVGDVPTKTVDDILAELGVEDVDVVASFANGREFTALQGAEHLFSKIKPQYVVAELQNLPPFHAGEAVWHHVDVEPKVYGEKLMSFGYDPFKNKVNGTPVTEVRVGKYRVKSIFFVRKDQ